MEGVAEQVSNTAEKVSNAVSKAADEVGAKAAQLVDIVDENILDYCTLDKTVRQLSSPEVFPAAVLLERHARADWQEG